jgi:Uncharacterized proteins, homologs of lactam utilization protein B
MGEGYPHDADIMPYISSVNIACGYHAGDENTMQATIALALKHNIAIGAHPSYPDRENFGRTDVLHTLVQPEQLTALVAAQIKMLQRLCTRAGVSLHHVKPHGALYNRAAADPVAAACICAAIRETDPNLMLYGLSGSVMETTAQQYKLRFVAEAFADRTYQDNGQLTPRKQPGALIEDTDLAVQQALQLATNNTVYTYNKKLISVKTDSICIHGDGAHAVAFAKAIHHALCQHEVRIAAP